MNKKQTEWFYLLTSVPRDIWTAFKAMVWIGAAIVVVRLAVQTLGTWAAIGIFAALPVLYALFWLTVTKEAFDAGKIDIDKIFGEKSREGK